ncbi:class I tRNA ligase family protein, partial [Pelagibacteraceae bacterium]|nr:class I tRNA ligase family protein [Pelagibacteraceae bacterium]
ENYNFHKTYKEVLNFCTLDLSSFYFDIRKDILYCDSLNSKKRKDCIIVLNIILECLLKWFAPIFVFTTEEIFSLVQKNETSIHESLFPVIPQNWEDNILKKKWENLYQIKQEVNIAIEEKRTNKEIGSSLEANILIHANEKEFNLLEGLELEEYFITSKAKKIKDINDKLKVIVTKASGDKCPRCWKILENKCMRCEEVMNK